jgi:hypothetical protein
LQINPNTPFLTLNMYRKWANRHNSNFVTL